MTNRPFSKRMLASKKTVGYRSHSYKWKYHPTPWKLFIAAVTAPQKATLSLFSNKRFVLGIVSLIVILGGIVLSQGSLFHSYSQNCMESHGRPPGAPCNDPSQVLWQGSDINSIADWNTHNGNSNSPIKYVSGSTCNSVWVLPITTGCIDMNFSGNSTNVAETKVPIGDLSAASKSLLAFHITWGIRYNSAPYNSSFNLRQATEWGYFITNNATEYQQPFYHELSNHDPSILLQNYWECDANCNTSNPTIAEYSAFKKSVGTNNTIYNENNGCDQTGSYYFCAHNLSPNGVFSFDSVLYLNYTGVVNGSPCSVTGNPGLISGAGCSWQMNEPLTGAAQSQYWQSSQTLPWFQLQAQQIYFGFFVGPMLGSDPAFSFQYASASAPAFQPSMDIFTFTPATTGPTIDTGGFFGPVIKALIGIGVFIVQNIINFLAFLANVLFPVLATVFSVLANALVAVLNAIGNFFGLGNIGTTISNFFTAVGNFLVNGVGAIFGQIANAGSFVVNGITAFVNIAGSYWTKITSFFSALGALFTIIGTVIGDFTNLSAFSGNIALFMDWTWGMYKTYDEGTEGFHRWLDFNEKVLLRLGTIAYFMADHLFQAILRVKQLIVNWV